MKPIRTFIFFAAVLLLLYIVALLLPEQGIGISGDYRVNFVNLDDIFREDTLGKAEKVKQLLAESYVTDDPETDPVVDLFMPPESASIPKEPAITPANKDSLQKSVYRIQFAKGGSH